MPSSYAHYRFGRQALPDLPENARRAIQHFRQLYDVGQHGPDFFFYYQPLFHTRMGDLGTSYHAMTGKAFFEAAAAKVRENPSEGAEAYLYGVLGHYILDSACHPLICQTEAEGKIGHTELETEFDRHLLVLDGKEPAHNQNLGSHIRLTWGESVTVSGFYPPATVYTVRCSVVNMALVNRMLAMKNRKLLEAIFRLGGKYGLQSVMYPRANRKCSHLMQPLMEHYEQSLRRYPAMLEQLTACIREGTPLGQEFEATFQE